MRVSNFESNPAEPRGTSIGDLLGVVRRRWWILALCLVLFPAAAIGLSQLQEKQYKAEANVLLSSSSLANSLTGNPDPELRTDRDRVAQTQIEIAKLPVIAEQTLAALKIDDLSASELSANVSVASLGKTDFLVISVTDSDPDRAVKLANRYALQYTNYRARLDNAAVSRTLREVNSRLDRLGKDDDTELGDSLREKQQELRTLQTLQTSNSVVVRRAQTAEQIAPTPARNASLALILGLIVGAALILIVDSLDTRLRGPDKAAEALGSGLLGRTPTLGIASDRGEIAMLADPDGARADAVRRVLGNIEFGLAAHPTKTLVALSAADDEDRSELVANLAVGFARSGRRVAAIDLDFRCPRLSEQFGAWGQYGLSDVAIGRVSLDQTLQSIAIHGVDGAATTNGGNGNGAHSAFTAGGSLDLLPTGSMPPDPGDFVSTPAIASVIETVAGSYELVLIDAPAIARAGDAARAAKHAGALIFATRADSLKSDSAKALRRQIEQTGVPLVGIVSTRDKGAAEFAERMRPAPSRRRPRRPSEPPRIGAGA